MPIANELKDTGYAIRIYNNESDPEGYLLFSNTDKDRGDLYLSNYAYIRITDQDMIDKIIAANAAGKRITMSGFHTPITPRPFTQIRSEEKLFEYLSKAYEIEIHHNKGLVSLTKGTEAQPSELLICIKDRDNPAFYIAYPARKTGNVLMIDIDEYY